MSETYSILYRGGSGELIEKKSRFIATLQPVETEAAALQFIAEQKKKYWDAKHNCYAYLIGEAPELARCGDDGEPAKTAGRPMLDVLQNEGIHNAVVVVTRYFGGVLLGTGGLVRAYQGAVKEGLLHCVVLRREIGERLRIQTDYTGLGKLQYLAAQLSLSILDTQYTEQVTVELLVPLTLRADLEKKLSEATNGKARTEALGTVYYGNGADGPILL